MFENPQMGYNLLKSFKDPLIFIMKSALKSSRPGSRQLQVAEEIRAQIARGVLRPGDRLMSYSEMHEQYGLHTVALQRVYEELARDGLIVREQGRGTFVAEKQSDTKSQGKSAGDAWGVSETRTRTGLIGVAGVGFTFREYSPYWVKLLGGIREVCDQADVQIVLLDHKSNKGWEKADGVLICQWSHEYTVSLMAPLIPCVSLMVPTNNVVSVYADDYRGARVATKYLVNLGHRKIAFLHSEDTTLIERRLAGWRDALKQSGIVPRASWHKTMKGDLDYGASYVNLGRESMGAWLESGWEKTGCTAILAHNDETAIGIIEALQEKKIRVPQDISVIGFDGATTHEYSLHLTTLEIPLDKIGQAAARLLLRQLEGEEIEEQHRVFPIALRTGRTTARAKTIKT